MAHRFLGRLALSPKQRLWPSVDRTHNQKRHLFDHLNKVTINKTKTNDVLNTFATGLEVELILLTLMYKDPLQMSLKITQ